MAEAVIVIDDEEPQTSAGTSAAAGSGTKFFCHLCKVEFDEVSAEYTCPLCAKGFIEELPATTEEPNDVEMQEDEAFFPFLPPAMNTRLTNEISSLLMSVTGNQSPDMNGRPPTLRTGGPTYYGSSRRGRRVRNQPSTVHFADFDNIVQEFLVNVTGRAPGGPLNGPMYFMGNPEDYVHGREGLDTIVTQLLNQMDGTGPPPLTKDKISEIPKVAVTKEQVDEKLQCSICWEDFQLDETVRKLPCVHIYHEMCIVPWLELHGTCPVCRQALCPEESDDGQQQQRTNDAVTNSLLNVAALYRSQGANDPMITITANRQPPAATASTSRRPQTARRGSRRRANDRSTEQPGSPSSRRDEDGNVDFDFD